MLAIYINFRAEENLSCAGIGFLRLRLYELADDRQIQLADQICHKYKAIFHYPVYMQGFAPEITGDLPRHLLHALFDLIRGQEDPGVFSLKVDGLMIVRFGAVHSSPSAGILVSSISTASPELQAKSRETGNPRIHTIWPALSITGHIFLWPRENCSPSRPGCNNSFTFFGDWLCTGRNLSPARQFLTLSSGPSRVGFKSVFSL